MVESEKLYKGYVKTKNKQSVEKLKDRSKFSGYDEVKRCPEFAGVLKTNVVMIDVDDKEQSEILMNVVEALQLNCRVYQTRRGKHFMFYNSQIQNNSNHSTLACGLTADIKVGFKCSYEVLKYDGKERFIEWDIEPGQDYQEVPKWLFPIKGTADFIGMETGDGRNQTLFNYILTLQSNDFTVDESRECIRLINQYILKEPLSDEELEVILRDSAFQKPVFFKGSVFLFERFAKYMKDKYQIKRINNQLHLYLNGVYQPGYGYIEAAMLDEIPNLPSSKRSEVLKCIEVRTIENTEQAPANLIAFRNGILDIRNDTLQPVSPEVIITNRIEFDYNPEAYNELLDKTLNKIACNDDSIRALLEEAVGYALFRRNELGKAFFLTGTGSNGKSTYLELISYMLGEKNVSNLDLKNLSGRFDKVQMFGKLANIGDDISDEFVVDTSFFKKVVTGNRIEAEHKGQPVFSFSPYVKLYFSANNIPRMGKGRDWEAIKRRMVIIPFEAKFSPEDPDYSPFIGSMLKEQESVEYLIKLAVQGLKRILRRNDFTLSVKVQEEINDFEKSNNPVLLFIEEYLDDGKQIAHELTEKVFSDYQGFCVLGGYKPMTKSEFSKSVCKALGLKTSPRKMGKIFIERDE